MELDLASLTRRERTELLLRARYEKAGYQKYHMARFEEYGLYQANRSFLSSDQIITPARPDFFTISHLARMVALPLYQIVSLVWSAFSAPGWSLRISA